MRTSGVCCQWAFRGRRPARRGGPPLREGALRRGSRWPAAHGGVSLPGRRAPPPILSPPIPRRGRRGSGPRLPDASRCPVSKISSHVYARWANSDGEGAFRRLEAARMSESPPRVYARGEVLDGGEPRGPRLSEIAFRVYTRDAISDEGTPSAHREVGTMPESASHVYTCDALSDGGSSRRG